MKTLLSSRESGRSFQKPLPEDLRAWKRDFMKRVRTEVEYEAGKVDSRPLSEFWGRPDPRHGGQAVTMDEYDPFS